MNSRIKFLFEEMSVKSDYEILDYGKNKNEMDEIAKKRGLKIPSKDIAMFKCKYAMVNETNLNGCILPKAEVEKSLESLNLKAIDKDHLRQSAVGMWLDSKLVGNDMVAYGGFWKSNFPEDYEEIKNRMKEGKMKISFEAWGDREFNKDGSYNLKNIEFAGGALLFDTEPAFPNAEVMEFSTNRVLEFAKIITEVTKADEIIDKKLIKILTEETYTTTEVPNDKGYEVEIKKSFKRTYHYSDGTSETTESNSDGTERYSQAQVEEMIKKAIKQELDKIDKEVATKELPENTKEKEDSKVMDELLKKYNKVSIEEVVKFLEDEVTSQKNIVASKEQEIATLKTEKDTLGKSVEESKLIVENSKLELEKVKAELAVFVAEKEKKVNEEKAIFVKARRDELGDYVKDLSDEDISNELKFENAKLKKERDEAIKKVSEVKGLDAGAIIVDEDSNTTKRKEIQAKAWNSK